MSRTRNTLIFTLLAMLLLSLALTGCSSGDAEEASESSASDSSIKVGDLVAAEWTSWSLYLAEVTAIEDDGSMAVVYQDDNAEATVEEDAVVQIVEKEWAVGDRVLAVWSTGKFYSGTIEEVDGEDYIVSWADGSEPSAVAADQIIAYDKQYADEDEE